jgi:hypothetical protein
MKLIEQGYSGRIILHLIFFFIIQSLLATGSSIAEEGSGHESFRVHGRLSVYNGNPSCRIWMVGSTRVLGVHETGTGEECPVPSGLAEILREDVNDRMIYADFEVTPLGPHREGIMQPVKVESAANIIVTNRKMQVLKRISGAIPESALPKGWINPDKSQVQGDLPRERDPSRYLVVRGDFDGNGLIDEAKLLIAKKGDRLALFAFLCRPSGKRDAILLTKEERPGYFGVVGIKKVRPGTYMTVCAELVNCPEKEPKQVTLSYDGIEFFKFEGFAVFFYWDSLLRSFKVVFVAD